MGTHWSRPRELRSPGGPIDEVGSERDVTRAEPIARKCISWARRYPWRSVTVASGAMPESISDLRTNTAVAIRRWDVMLYQRVREQGVQFGDYGIAHPKLTTGRWPPMPNLRYTDTPCWWIYRWSRDTGSNASFYDLCATLVQSDHWPHDGTRHCWGDAEARAPGQTHRGSRERNELAGMGDCPPSRSGRRVHWSVTSCTATPQSQSGMPGKARLGAIANGYTR